jgi:hypothetical protein
MFVPSLLCFHIPCNADGLYFTVWHCQPAQCAFCSCDEPPSRAWGHCREHLGLNSYKISSVTLPASGRSLPNCPVMPNRIPRPFLLVQKSRLWHSRRLRSRRTPPSKSDSEWPESQRCYTRSTARGSCSVATGFVRGRWPGSSTRTASTSQTNLRGFRIGCLQHPGWGSL